MYVVFADLSNRLMILMFALSHSLARMYPAEVSLQFQSHLIRLGRSHIALQMRSLRQNCLDGSSDHLRYRSFHHRILYRR
jgi:hypothetical protein